MKDKREEKCDELWRLKDPTGKCELCEFLGLPQKQAYMQPHHVIFRTNKRVRWDLRNRCFLCPGHHTIDKLSAHGSPGWFKDQFKKFRKEDFEYLESVREEIAKYIDFDEILERLGGNHGSRKSVLPRLR